jgi:hypothetical protein
MQQVVLACAKKCSGRVHEQRLSCISAASCGSILLVCGGLLVCGLQKLLLFFKVQPVLVSVREAQTYLKLHLQFSIFMHACRGVLLLGVFQCGMWLFLLRLCLADAIGSRIRWWRG